MLRSKRGFYPDATNISSRTMQTFIVGLGSICTIGLSISMAMVLSRLLDKKDYGTFRQVLYVYSSMTVLFQVGLPKATSYFLPKLPLNEGKSTLKHIVILLSLSGISFSLLLYGGANWIGSLLHNEDLPRLLRVYSPMPTFILPTLALQGVCMTFSEPKLYVIFQVFTKILALLSVCIPVYFGYSLRFAIFSWAIASCFSLCVALFLMFYPYLNTNAKTCGVGFFSILKFCVPLVLTSILAVLLSSADRFIISRCFGAEVFAEYINGAMELPLISIITSSTAVVLLPVFSRSYEKENGKEEIMAIWTRSILKTTMILYPIAVICFVYADDIMNILYSNRYIISSKFFKIYLFLCVIRVVSYIPLMIGIGALGSYVIGHIVACIVAWGGGYAIAILTCKPEYVALTFVLSIFIMVFCFLYGISKKMHVRIREIVPYWQLGERLIISIITGALVWFLTSYIDPDTIFQNLIRLCMGTAVFIPCYLLIAKTFGIDVVDFIRPILSRLGLESR